MQDAISGVLGQHAEIVTRWVLVAETLDADGDRAAWMLAQEDSKSWDALGLLAYAEQTWRNTVGAVDPAGE